MTMLAASIAGLALLVFVHVVTPSLTWLAGTPRSIWLSIAGGVSVAYVFVHFMPELATGQAAVARAAGGLELAERHIFVIALVGLITFYGLDRMVQTSRARRQGDAAAAGRDAGDEAAPSARVFWIHMASFAIYNLLVGYLLLRREVTTLRALGFFAVAMALHFVVTDFGLSEAHKAPYQRLGRWLLIAAVAAGWALGVATRLPEAAIAALTAFLGGGVVLNVIKEEVPSERQSRFWAFAAGAGAYTALLLAL